jgi:ATP-dependent Zn protease
MAAEPTTAGLLSAQESQRLAAQWRSLTRAATFVAVVTSPVLFVWLHDQAGVQTGWAIVATAALVMAFRGFVDLVFRRFIPWPSLFATDSAELREDDVVHRQRMSFWRFVYRTAVGALILITFIYVVRLLSRGADDASWYGTAKDAKGWAWAALTAVPQASIFIIFFFLFNLIILFGPLMFMGVSQIRGFEPGDADWGVRLDDVRGQAEAKEEVRRIVSLWQSGEAFERAGGKRERGLLFLGAPGTGKTMLAKAIATGFNSPFVTVPGSGFAQTFMGMDAVIVRWLAWKAKRLARKWGGQCIVFIDEIDAVGMRRAALGGGAPTFSRAELEDYCFHGPFGALTSTGDLILETRAWRERLFAARAPEAEPPRRFGRIVNQALPGMFGGGGQLALNQLLVVMDGIDNPPFFRRVFTSKVNNFLDASYLVPRRLGRLRLRLRAPKPRQEQIYFIGATNAPMNALDPALTRPGRMGRHVWFRTPTKHDRLDIFDLYLAKVAHHEDLDRERRRDELARITNGYAPAMIEQVCSMALTYAHHDGRDRFRWEDLVEAMTTVESGTAVGVDYVPSETRAIAIHEAGHAACGHVYMKGSESTRLSIRMRGNALGHHMAMEKEERFSSWRHEDFGKLVWGLGSMAAERVFYGENSRGVGGDVQSVTALAALMVGAWGMGEQLDSGNGNGELAQRFERLGTQIMDRTAAGGGAPHADPVGSVLADRDQRSMIAQLLGQAYLTAHAFVDHNRQGIEKIADAVVEKREIYGDELLELLESAKLRAPELQPADANAWPNL